MTYAVFKVRNMRWPERDRYAKSVYIPEFETYRGEIVPNPSWLSDDYISMTTGNPYFPVRSFERDRIVTEKVTKRLPAIARPTTYKVKSSKGDKFYIVSLHDKVWSCQCPGYQFRQLCKHIVEAQNRRRANAKRRRK